MEIDGFGVVLLFFIGGLIFVLTTLGIGKLLRPARPNEEKLATYESGEVPVKNAWGNFNVRFYIIALIFLLFEVELVFLFPWAVVFGNADLNQATDGLWGWFSLIEIFLFIGLLTLGLIYVWKNKMLDWVKPKPEVKNIDSKVPKSMYEEINRRYS